MSHFKRLTTLAFACTLGLAAANLPAKEMTEQDVEEIVRDYILENPEIIKEAIVILQEREAMAKAEQEAEALKQLGKTLTKSELDPVGGNPKGAVTLVEFYDYNCGYCKRANGTLQALIKANPDLRVVYKEWPILTETSGIAARIALAVNLAKPEKYEALHRALLNTRSLKSEADVWKVVEKQGIDRAEVTAMLADPRIDQHLHQTQQLAQKLGITGTPAFIVGDQVLKGAYPQSDIQEAIDKQS